MNYFKRASVALTELCLNLVVDHRIPGSVPPSSQTADPVSSDLSPRPIIRQCLCGTTLPALAVVSECLQEGKTPSILFHRPEGDKEREQFLNAFHYILH